MSKAEHPFPKAARALLAELSSTRVMITVAVLLLVILLLASAGFRVQASGSGPRGIWKFVPGPLAHNAWVAICPAPGIARLVRERGYAPPGPCAGDVAPLLKQVIALPGDRVELGPAGIVVNGGLLASTDVRETDRRGRPLPHPAWGSHPVAPGTLWVANQRHDSFDSRYFGPIDQERVLSLADAVLTRGARP